MATPDYIPRSDSDFNSWIHNFATFLNANLAALGLTAEDVAPLNTKVAKWDIAYPSHTTAHAAAQGARRQKDDTRTGLLGDVRPLVAQLQGKTIVTDAQRQSLGVTVRSTTKAAVSAPTSRPAGQV